VTEALAVEGLSAGYGEADVLCGVSLAVPEGAVVALLGPNGAGKTTLLRCVAGLHAPRSGRVLLGGADVTGRHPAALAEAGVCLVPEGRGVFPSLTVRDNLRLQAPRGRPREALESAVATFPVLGARLGQRAGTLSGGEQQMLALARALCGDARVVLVDEASMGLAPRFVAEIYRSLWRLAESGRALVVVEQHASQALELADYVWVLRQGRVVFAGEPAELEGVDLFGLYAGDPGGRTSDLRPSDPRRRDPRRSGPPGRDRAVQVGRGARVGRADGAAEEHGSAVPMGSAEEHGSAGRGARG
jgi:branched-chain amino acid transport system ATP-binding protein